jgi:hypothetical protein
MKSRIFLSNLSVVDHAYINYKGQVIGGSFNPSFIVTGEIDEKEKVVVDFSTIKKDMKTVIDAHSDVQDLNGFDHKLWFIIGYSNGKVNLVDDRYVITSEAGEVNVPRDALKIIEPIDNLTPEYTIEYIGKSFEQHLTTMLSKKYPDIDISVECFNNIDTHVINKQNESFLFTYSHGLKDSTSYGCQNVAHGHLSFIQPNSKTLDSHTYNLFKQIASDLDGAVFINKENVVADTDDYIKIEYTSIRGYFSAMYQKQSNNIFVLDTETTIEFLAEFVSDKYNVRYFYISEGLSKGTYLD